MLVLVHARWHECTAASVLQVGSFNSWHFSGNLPFGSTIFGFILGYMVFLTSVSGSWILPWPRWRWDRQGGLWTYICLWWSHFTRPQGKRHRYGCKTVHWDGKPWREASQYDCTEQNQRDKGHHEAEGKWDRQNQGKAFDRGTYSLSVLDNVEYYSKRFTHDLQIERLKNDKSNFIPSTATGGPVRFDSNGFGDLNTSGGFGSNSSFGSAIDLDAYKPKGESFGMPCSNRHLETLIILFSWFLQQGRHRCLRLQRVLECS